MRNKIGAYAALLLIVIACKEDEPLRIDSQLATYFAMFEEEAGKRGLNVDLESLRIEGIIELIEGNVNGQCRKNTTDPDQIVIDTEYWNKAGAYGKEFIVFHELGHCVLNREHLDTKNNNGTCASIMHSGETDCLNAYGQVSRSTYLDELFAN